MKARTVRAKRRGKRNKVDEEMRKPGGKRRFIENVSDSSDEDFFLDEDEDEDEDGDDDDVVESEGASEEEEEEESESESDDGEQEITWDEDSEYLSDGPKSKRKRGVVGRRTQALRKKPRNRATKRVKISSSDDEDFEPDSSFASDGDDDEEEEEEKIVIAKSSRPRIKRARKSKSSSTRKSRKRKKRTPAQKLKKKRRKAAPASRKLANKRTKKTQQLVASTARNGVVSDEDFVTLSARQGTKFSRNSRTGRKSLCMRKAISITDSDFSYHQSDSEYTICEEDSEPSYCPQNYRWKPANRPMRLSLTEKQEIPPSAKGDNVNRDGYGFRKKGKEKLLEMGKPVCGICLSDDGKADRGKLDCCDHYFCFVCIMEWAKVESRCPMCKQRFISISKSMKSGKGLRGTTIGIPLRDQVYQPSEEEVMGFLDPYASIVCSECHEAGDDSLLLLCDLCDSAHHTYCVGLGRTVPEGDWYCQGCQTSMPRHANTQAEEVEDFVLDFHNDDDDLSNRAMVEESPVARIGAESVYSNRNLFPSLSSTPLTDTRPSQVRTIRRRVVRRRSTPNVFLTPPGPSDTARTSVSQSQRFESQSQVSGVGARTLSGQRRLQEHIQVLRDNWSAPERGFLQVYPSSSSVAFNSSSSNRADVIIQPGSSNSSCLCPEAAQKSNWDASAKLENAAVNSDVDNAWAMMERARALGGGVIDPPNCQRIGSYCQGPSTACVRQDFSESMYNSGSRFVNGSNSSAGSRSRTSSIQERQGLPTTSHGENPGRRVESISYMDGANNSLQGHNYSNRILLPSLPQRSNSPSHQLNNPVCSGSHPIETGFRKVEGAKDKVLAMVKAHIKNKCIKKQIGKDQFKEIARCSTHTILAACRIEHSRHRAQPFQMVSCFHAEQQCCSSDLMSGCCKDCFNSFVKDVVDKIADEKAGIGF
eukprot:Gb_36420 [translate_table: standard]